MKKPFFFVLLAILTAPAAAQFARTDPATENRLARLQRAVAPLYRKPTRKELREIAPAASLSERYAAFLRLPDTGLTRLVEDRGCADSAKVVVATADCLRYTMPGGGSSFSFRTGNYRLARLADLTYTDRSFQSLGVRTHGILVNLGDVPLETVGPATRGMRYLMDFRPETDFEKGRAVEAALTTGVRRDGFVYRRGLYIVENATFALRSVAYDGKYLRAAGGLTYNEFDFDKRRDIVVVFRIVEKDAASVTILWRVLRETAAPEMKRNAADDAADARE